MEFTKMHGAGNDFVVMDARNKTQNWSELAQEMSDRHTGIGSDGILLVLDSNHADIRMQMFNPDGSEGSMCGNGIRCFAKYVVENSIVAESEELRIESAVDIHQVQLLKSNGTINRARVNMGAPRLKPEEIPVDPNHRIIPVGGNPSDSMVRPFNENELVYKWSLAVEGNGMNITCVSMGNPHAVTFLNTPINEFPLHEVGPKVEHHPLFPDRVNFEIVNIIDKSHLDVRVWERGAGLTMACGSGACAVAVAAYLHGYIDDNVAIRLPGGTLNIAWDGKGDVIMEGPAETVFTGIWS